MDARTLWRKPSGVKNCDPSIQPYDFIGFFIAYFLINLGQSAFVAVSRALTSGLPTKLSTEIVGQRLGHNRTPNPLEKVLDFDHTSRRLANLAVVAVLGIGAGLGD